MTNSEICIQLPTATLIAKSNFPLLATITAVVCSAALLMMGMIMSVIHSFEMLGWSATSPSRESTKKSDVTYARAVTTTNSKSADVLLSLATSSLLDDAVEVDNDRV